MAISKIIFVPFRAASQVCPSSQTNYGVGIHQGCLKPRQARNDYSPLLQRVPQGTPSFFVHNFPLFSPSLCLEIPLYSPSFIGLLNVHRNRGLSARKGCPTASRSLPLAASYPPVPGDARKPDR